MKTNNSQTHINTTGRFKCVHLINIYSVHFPFLAFTQIKYFEGNSYMLTYRNMFSVCSSVHGISQECKRGLPFPSSGDLPDPGIEPGSPALRWILNRQNHHRNHLHGDICKWTLLFQQWVDKKPVT